LLTEAPQSRELHLCASLRARQAVWLRLEQDHDANLRQWPINGIAIMGSVRPVQFGVE
jgi:hypothetical protein